nr:classical arabinogalactan protein 9-like [Parasteatoda tepidariorum]
MPIIIRTACGGKVLPSCRQPDSTGDASSDFDIAISNASEVFENLSNRLSSFNTNFFLDLLSKNDPAPTPKSDLEIEKPTEPVPVPEPSILPETTEPEEEASASEPVFTEIPCKEPPTKKRRKKKKSAVETKASSPPKPVASPPPSSALPTPESPPPVPMEIAEEADTQASPIDNHKEINEVFESAFPRTP